METKTLEIRREGAWGNQKQAEQFH